MKVSIIRAWRREVKEKQADAMRVEKQLGIRTSSSGSKDFVTRNDIEELERRKVPWLYERRSRDQ